VIIFHTHDIHHYSQFLSDQPTFSELLQFKPVPESQHLWVVRAGIL